MFIYCLRVFDGLTPAELPAAKQLIFPGSDPGVQDCLNSLSSKPTLVKLRAGPDCDANTSIHIVLISCSETGGRLNKVSA